MVENNNPCDSCLIYKSCEQTLKDNERCDRYQTKIEEIFDGRLVSFRCSVNNRLSVPQKREDCDAIEIAKAINVRPKDVFKLLVTDNVPMAAWDVSAYFDDGGKFVPAFLAEELMREYRFATMVDSKEIYVYIDGYYQPIGDMLIKRECKQRLGNEYRRNRAGEVTDYIEASTYVERREEPPNLLPLNNGVLDLNTMELKPYSPEYMFFNKLNVDYNPDADCPEIKKFHEEITNDKEDIDILEEVTGYSLYRRYLFHKALMLVGGGENGKSTWLAMVRTFLGDKNVSGRSLFELEEVRFARADLFSKYANIYADLPDRALQRTGMFKMLTGGDQLAAEKKFRDSFHFVNYAKLMFSANKVPETVDDTDAFFRRWIILNFPNVFNGEKRDPHKLEKITTPEELSGLLNLALKALRKLLNNGDFSYTKATEEIREDYVRKSSPIASFVMDCLEVDTDAFIEKKKLFNMFAAYCRERKIPCVTQQTFFKNLPQHVSITDIRPTVKNKRITAFKGIRYSDGVSRLSGLSRHFYILSEQAKNFKASWIVEKLEGDFCCIKIGKTLDRVDIPDMKQDLQDTQHPDIIDDMLASKCGICRQALPSDNAYCTVLEGKTIHEACYRKIKAQEKKNCKHLATKDSQPYCEWLQSILAKESLCTVECDGYEEAKF